MLVSVLVALLLICGFLICCSYFKLESRYESLSQTVRQQQQEVGLPDDYEYEEDNVYMQEV